MVLSFLSMRDVFAVSAARKNWKLSQLCQNNTIWSQLISKKLKEMRTPITIPPELIENLGHKQAFIAQRAEQLKTQWHYMGDSELLKQFKNTNFTPLSHVKLGTVPK